MVSTKGIRKYKLELINLYNHVNTNGFYTRDINHIFPAQRIHMLSGSGILEPTGKFYIGKDHARRYNEWKFSTKGVDVVESFL